MLEHMLPLLHVENSNIFTCQQQSSLLWFSEGIPPQRYCNKKHQNSAAILSTISTPAKTTSHVSFSASLLNIGSPPVVYVQSFEKNHDVQRYDMRAMGVGTAVTYSAKHFQACLRSSSVVLNLFYISYTLLSNNITRFTPNTLSGANFLKIRI